MSINTLLSELWRTIRRNNWMIIGAILGLLLSLGLRFIWNITYRSDQEALTYLNQVYSQEPAEFQIVVYLEDGNHYTNTNILDEYFVTPTVLAEIEESSGVDLTAWYEAEQAMGFEKASDFRGGAAVVRDQQSGVFTMRFLVGKTAEENLAVAQAYYDRVLSPDYPFLKDKRVVPFTEPFIGEKLDLDYYRILPSETTLNMYQGTGIKLMISYAIAGVIVGAMAGLAAYIFNRFYAKDIKYAYEYTVNFGTSHFLAKDLSYIQEYICTPIVSHRLVIHQNSSSSILTILNDANWITSVQSLKELTTVKDVDDIVILIESGKTTKDWFKKVQELSNLFKKPLRIVHYTNEGEKHE